MPISLIAARFAGSDVLISQDMSGWLTECIRALDAHPDSDKLCSDNMQSDFWPAPDSWMSQYRPYKVVNGTLMINVKGMLIHNYGYQVGDWATGYEYLRQCIVRGFGDIEVKRIAMICNSGGGHVAGNFDLVDQIFNLRGTKPIEAFVNEHAYSACYSLASACDKITLTRTSGVGSVGVLTSHVDYSKYLEKAGIEITLLAVGEFKTEGNSYEPLSAAAKERTINRLTGIYNIFTSTVARNLNISEDIVRGTKALTFSADDAVNLGLAHAISSFDSAITAYASGTTLTNEDDSMSNETENAEAAKAETAKLDAARSEGMAIGATNERARISGILGCDEAKTRSTLANHIAMNTDMSVEAAKGILGNSAEEKQVVAKTETTTTTNAFAAAMDGTENPDISADGSQTEVEANSAQSILADYRSATGEKPRTVN